jgi:hypothetical protein
MSANTRWGECFLASSMAAFSVAAKQRKHAELGILGFGNELRLPNRHLGAEADPFVTLLLRTGYGPSIPTQEWQRPRDRLGHLLGSYLLFSHVVLPHHSKSRVSPQAVPGSTPTLRGVRLHTTCYCTLISGWAADAAPRPPLRK